MDILENSLKKIQFTSENGLVFCDRLNDDVKHIGERYHIEEKARKLGVAAVLFRRKYDEHNTVIDSKPVLYIYKEENTFFNSQEHKDLHAKIWSAGDIEVYFIVSETRIDIINARKPAEVKENASDDNKLDITNLRLISEALQQFNDQRFSAIVFGRGSFWEQEDFFDDRKETFYRNQLKTENTPFSQLLDYLIAIREDLHNKRKELSTEAEDLHDKQKKLSAETMDKLLIVCILIKFLEEIRDDEGTHTLRDIYKKHDINDFAEALDNKLCVPILNQLRGKIKGSIFDIFSDEEEQIIGEKNLPLIADFLRAKYDPRKKQYFLWKQYSFNYLPVELISAIYENFLPKEKGVVYTPPLLVNFLIDEVMPLDKAKDYFSENQFKVLDPSCGSGVFLVAAYKRMLQWWSINEYYARGKSGFSKPVKAICQEILQKNIFGVDINETATLITVFSLTIALLDKLEPKEIWNNLELNNLQENIQTRNFFEWATEHGKDSKRFDLVIGNPPFNPMSGINPTNAVSHEQIKLFGITNKDIPDSSFALKFFEGSMFFGQHTCLILPSNVLLYTKSKLAQKYRHRIFTEFTVKKIFDFTHLRRHVLFGSAEVSACAILANPEKSQGQNIEHIVIKRLTSVEKKLFFEIDHYDYHVVPHNWAIDPAKQFVWKTNLLGGGRLFHLIYRLSLLENLVTFIKNKKRENEEWVFQDGYKNKLENSQKTIFYLYNRDKVSHIENGKIISFEKEVYRDFGRPRPKNLYQLPLLIIHKKTGEQYLPIGIKETHTDDYLVFNSSFVGIHAPKEDFGILQKIYDRLKQYSNIYLLWILATSPSAMIGQETAIKKTDLDTFPFPENHEYLDLSKTERTVQDDVLQYYVHLGKATSEDGKELHKKVTREQLEKFGQIFCDTINSIHAENNMLWQIGSVYETSEKTYIIYQFIFGLQKKSRPFEVQATFTKDLDNIIFNAKDNQGAIFTRIARIYESQNDYDCLFLIKPVATRYWLGSIALRDADDTIWDYYEAGY